MAILKCKMCGGDIILSEDKTFGTCDSCGSTMTFPKVSDEHKLNLYNRANHFRRQNEFDKAIAAYDKILDQDDTDAEAHWGAVLSRYGIEYVEDPATHERIPTCHRVQAASILSDPDYLSALEYAPDTASRDIYEQEARRIAEIQKGILAISSQEKPYDVFICYKETDEEGRRTRDSALAQEIYYQLTNEGYKVFFSRITLEDKLGQEYEPYIFAALNSARVMLVIGTKPEFFNAVWAKNEWSRFLALMKNDRSRLLIPCYRDMDPYDLPEELSALQSQDMSKIGFMQDLIRGIKKVLDSKKPAETKPTTSQILATGANIENLMKRAWLFMEDGDFKSANEYLDKVLDENAEYAPAYVGKVCTSLAFSKEAQLGEATFLYGEHPDWKKALRFASPRQKAVYEGYYEQVRTRVAQQIRDYVFDCAIDIAVNPKADREELDRELEQYKTSCAVYGAGRADGNRRKNAKENESSFNQAILKNEPGDITEQSYKTAAELFRVIGDEESNTIANNCLILAEKARQKAIYQQAKNKSFHSLIAKEYDQLAEQFQSIPDYKDAIEQAKNCRRKAEHSRQLYEAAVKAMNDAGSDSRQWKQVQELLNQSDLGGYSDISVLRQKAAQRYQQCVEAEIAIEKAHAEKQRKKEEKKQRRTIIILWLFIVLVCVSLYIIFKIILPKEHYDKGIALRNSHQWEEAIAEFEQANNLGDTAEQIQATYYMQAQELLSYGKTNSARTAFIQAKEYKDSTMQLQKMIKPADRLTAGRFHTVGILTDGTVVTAGYNEYKQCETEQWTDIIAVAAGNLHTVGLRANGSVVAVGANGIGQCNVNNWTDIIAIAAGWSHTVGLKADGTVIAVGDNREGQCRTTVWEDITDIAAGCSNHTVGLRKNGTVVAVGENDSGECNTDSWTDIKAIAAGYYHTVGLRTDGTVIAVGANNYGQCNTNKWSDIVSIAASGDHTVGLRSDGTVVAVGDNSDGQCNTEGWTNIITIAAGGDCTVALCADGTVIAVGSNEDMRLSVSNWNLLE